MHWRAIDLKFFVLRVASVNTLSHAHFEAQRDGAPRRKGANRPRILSLTYRLRGIFGIPKMPRRCFVRRRILALHWQLGALSKGRFQTPECEKVTELVMQKALLLASLAIKERRTYDAESSVLNKPCDNGITEAVKRPHLSLR